jgi:hypothetical protein
MFHMPSAMYFLSSVIGARILIGTQDLNREYLTYYLGMVEFFVNNAEPSKTDSIQILGK